ncbi:hypothetical protein Tco_1394966 [Tanacetum coccineum]
MGTLSLVSKYLKDLEECMDDGDSRVAKEAKLFDALKRKSFVIEVDDQKNCNLYQGAWDAKLDLADSANYVTEKVLENIGFLHVILSDYGRKMVNDVNVEIHGVKFKADFVVLDYVNEGEPSILFGRDFLATTKSQVDFGLGEIRMNLTKFKEGIDVIDLLEEVGSSSEEVVKMGKANRNKGYNINKLTPPPSLRLEEIPPTSTILPQPIYHPLTAKQKEKMKEVLDIKYKELEESKPILEMLENYVIYKKKLDEILIGKERLNKKEFSEEDKVGIIEHDLPKKMCDLGNYVLPVKINGVVEMVALVDTGATKAMGEVKNVRIQIRYQAYVVDLLILDIPVDPELPLLLGRPFLRTCEAIIDMGRGMLCIDDGVIRHTYFPKPRSKSYVEAFEMEGEDDWLGSFEVGRDEDGNVKYGPVAPSFIDIKDDMERALAMEAYFNPFKNVIVFKKLVDFLGSLPVQLKNLDWGNEGYGTYKKVDGDGDWHARFEIVTPSGRKFNRAFKTKTTTRKLSGKFKTEDILRKGALEYQGLLTNFFTEEEVEGHLFEVYFGKLEVDDKQIDHKDYWTRVGKQTLTNHKEVLVKEPLMRIVHKVIVGSLVHRNAPRTKENSVICAGHYVTKIAYFLGYCVDEEINKCSEPIDYDYWTSKMLADELDMENTCLKKETEMPTQVKEGSRELRQDHRGLNMSWGDWNASLSEIERGNVWRDSMLIQNNYMLKHSMPILHHFANQDNLAYPTYEPPNVPPYSYPYIPSPYPYTHYPNPGNQGNQGGHYGLGGNDYFTSAMPDFGGSSLGNAFGGSSRGAGFNDDDDMDLGTSQSRQHDMSESDSYYLSD